MPYWQTELDWTDSDPHNSRTVGQPPRQPFHFTPTHRSQSWKSEIMNNENDKWISTGSIARGGCHKNLRPATCFLPSQEWHCTEKTTKFGGHGYQRYWQGMPHPTPKGQWGTPLPQVPKGRPKSHDSTCAGRFQPDPSWAASASICTLVTTINGLHEKCREETHQTTSRATGPS